jgi:hypothetical protein
MCSQSHAFPDCCAAFATMTPRDRRDVLQAHALCVLCMQRSHGEQGECPQLTAVNSVGYILIEGDIRMHTNITMIISAARSQFDVNFLFSF